MPDEFQINAAPELRTVTPGAKVTYILDEKLGGPKLDSVSARWFAVNDPKVVTFSRPGIIPGPNGDMWEDATWSVPGHHRIVCRVTRAGVTTDYTYEQWVVPVSQELTGGPRLPRQNDDPDATLDTLSRFADVLRAVNAKAPPKTPADKDNFEKQLKQVEEFRDKLAERLKSTKNFRKHHFQAEHFDAATQKRSPLRVFISKVEFKKWRIVDWTNPMVRSATGEYEGLGQTSDEAIRAAIKDWNEDNRYPEGGITFKIPKILDASEQTGNFETDGSAYWDSVSAFFGWIGLGAAVVAGVVTLIAPVPGSQLVSAAIWTSIFSSSAAAAINIGTRIDEGFSSWQANAFDVLTIVGNLFGATGILWSRGANVLVKSGDKVVKFALIGAVTSDGVQGVMLGADYMAKLEAIQNDPSIPPDQRTNRIVQLLSSALVDGVLIYVSVKGTNKDLANLELRGQLNTTTSAERLKQLGDPKATVDLSAPTKVEGQAGSTPHTTRVGVDQEMQVPSGTGHSARTRERKPPAPKGPQKTANLDQLYADAGAAQGQLTTLTNTIAGELGGTAVIPPTLKGRARAEEKIKADYGGDASQIVDLARSSIVFKTMAQVRSAMAKVGASAKVVRVKDRFKTPLNGYRDVLFNLEMPNGHVVEMQIHLEGIIKVKDGPGHALYEQQRKILADAAGRKLSAGEKAQVESLGQQMRELYDEAFKAAE